jgi:hypothetical protein
MLEFNDERSFYENLKHHRNVVSFPIEDFYSPCLLSISCEVERKNLILALKEMHRIQKAQNKPVLLLKKLSEMENYMIDNIGALLMHGSAYMFFAQTSLYLPSQVILVENTLNQFLPVVYKDKKEFFIRKKIDFQYIETENVLNFSDLIIYANYKAVKLILSAIESTDFIIYVN